MRNFFKTSLFVLLCLLVCFPAHAVIWYLRVPSSAAQEYLARLDVLKGSFPFTKHYTFSISSFITTETTVLLPIDERAQSVLTPEEWASRLATMPAEFVRPLPE